MHRQLIDSYNDNIQQIIEFVHPTGTFCLKEYLLWDERIDGQLEVEIEKIGGYKRVNGKLIFDSEKFVAHQNKLAEMEAEKIALLNKKNDRLNLLKNKTANINDRLNALIEHLGLDV